MKTPSEVAQMILRQLGHERAGQPTYAPKWADLEPLAREYVRLTGSRGGDPTLGGDAFVVGPDAVREFGAFRRLTDEESRAALTVILYGALWTSDGMWRRHNASTTTGQVDVSARATRIDTIAGPITKIITTSTRDANRGGRRR